MKLLEYEAKQILQQCDLPVPNGTLADVADYQSPLPVVIKSQVFTGGRGKAGGIKIARTADELQTFTDEILHLTIKGQTPRQVLYEELLDIRREHYLSLMINRATAAIELVAHALGGVEVEENEAGEFYRAAISRHNTDQLGEALAELYDLPEKAFALGELLHKLYDCFVASDATLIEINPLVLTASGRLVAGDCKMTVDDAAIFRHPEWQQLEDQPANTNFVTLSQDGTVATIANGAGLAMATVDAVAAAGHTPANFLDIGGGATTAKIVESFAKISEFPHVNAIVINIFGGIVQCDTVAQAIIEARATFPKLPRLLIRLSGNRHTEAAELLAAEQLPLYDTLEDCIEELSA